MSARQTGTTKAETCASAGDVPAHIAIIMDGNGRWAERRGHSRLRGHEEGAKSVREIVRACGEKGVRELTLYAFSTENWRRPKTEVTFLMGLLRRYLVSERKEAMKNNVKFRAIGRLNELPAAIRKELEKTVDMSEGNSGLILRLALNYGGRAEIVDAMKRVAEEVRHGRMAPEDIDETMIRRHMYDGTMSDPDLVIRTGGEMRLSNFLLWFLAYSELWVTPVCWPEFRTPHLDEAFSAYASRQRRFGAVPGAGADVIGRR
jgi:undecaprenyl diphosphate synthase